MKFNGFWNREETQQEIIDYQKEAQQLEIKRQVLAEKKRACYLYTKPKKPFDEQAYRLARMQQYSNQMPAYLAPMQLHPSNQLNAIFGNILG
jgi:hypothetical protein